MAFAFSFLLLALTRRFSACSIHRVALLIGGAGLASVSLWTTPAGPLVSMAALGIGWASILSMPYAMLANALPPERMGFYMGVFNFFIVLPQIVASALLGAVVREVFGGHAMPAVVIGGIALLCAGLAIAFVPQDGTEAPVAA